MRGGIHRGRFGAQGHSAGEMAHGLAWADAWMDGRGGMTMDICEVIEAVAVCAWLVWPFALIVAFPLDGVPKRRKRRT